MAFDWRAFLDLAEELASRDVQAAWRTAIGRAYYAALGRAVEALPSARRATVSPGNAHERVWQLDALSTVVPCRRLGNLGFRLRDRRRVADYLASRAVPRHEARQAVRDAQQLVALLDSHGYQP